MTLKADSPELKGFSVRAESSIDKGEREGECMHAWFSSNAKAWFLFLLLILLYFNLIKNFRLSQRKERKIKTKNKSTQKACILHCFCLTEKRGAKWTKDIPF